VPGPESNETTAGGALGRLVGKTKAAVGSLIGNKDLQREGNLQQAQSEAEVRAGAETRASELRRQEITLEEQRVAAAAERDRLRSELEAQDRKERIERTEARQEREVEVAAARKRAVIEEREKLKDRASRATETAALHQRAAAAAEIADLERQAAGAEQTAEVIDPEAT
jgi:uncharacterized protein YjbJ (UPF0337 family)